MVRERYEREVDYLWQRLRGLATVIPRLEALTTRNADRRVTSLVQTAAVAFAAVHARIHDDGQAIVRPLVAAAMPECLRPRPSSTILKLTRAADAHGVLFGQVGRREVAFELKWPAQVDSLDLAAARLTLVHAKLQVLQLTIAGRPNVPLGSVLPKSLRFFVRMDAAANALDLLQALHANTATIRAEGYDERGATTVTKELPASVLRWTRVDAPEEPLTRAPADRFPSSTDLRDLYAFPESFCFFDLDVSALQGSRMARLELTLPLARIVAGTGTLGVDHVHLGCAPATNEFVAAIEPLRAAPGVTDWPLVLKDRPEAEVLHVRELVWRGSNDAHTRRPILSWEAPTTPHRFSPDEQYYVVEQSIAIGEARTQTRVSFASAAGFGRPLPGVAVEGEVLVSDGSLTSRLGVGDIGRGANAANVTRVTPSRRANLGTNYAWRMNAYARMPPSRFVGAKHLREFVKLHDSSDVRDERARVQVPRFAAAQHAREHRLVEGMFEWGDAFAVDLVAQASAGEAWLIGELLSRAIAERNERLRYSRLTMTREGAEFATFEPRQGVRFPFPIG